MLGHVARLRAHPQEKGELAWRLAALSERGRRVDATEPSAVQRPALTRPSMTAFALGWTDGRIREGRRGGTHTRRQHWRQRLLCIGRRGQAVSASSSGQQNASCKHERPRNEQKRGAGGRGGSAFEKELPARSKTTRSRPSKKEKSGKCLKKARARARMSHTQRTRRCGRWRGWRTPRRTEQPGSVTMGKEEKRAREKG